MEQRREAGEFGRRVLITGGAQGIGKILVEAFVARKDRVAFCDVEEEKGKQLAQNTGAWYWKVDVSQEKALDDCLQTLFQTWGDLDIIINNAAIGVFKPLVDLTTKEFDHTFQVNLRPVLITARALARHRKTLQTVNPFGRIINLCSTRYLMSEPGTEAYSASKGGVFSLTHALALSLQEFHITVNSISPGWIETNHYESLTPADHRQHPSGRVGKPEDIARLCLFLCEPLQDFINGENIVADGGMTRKMIYS